MLGVLGIMSTTRGRSRTAKSHWGVAPSSLPVAFSVVGLSVWESHSACIRNGPEMRGKHPGGAQGLSLRGEVRWGGRGTFLPPKGPQSFRHFLLHPSTPRWSSRGGWTCWVQPFGAMGQRWGLSYWCSQHGLGWTANAGRYVPSRVPETRVGAGFGCHCG